MRIVEVKDLPALHDFHAVTSAAHDHDYVALPADPVEEMVPLVQGQMPSGEHVTFHVGYEGDTPVACLTVTLWTLDNLTAANVDGQVHPDHRRRGLGRALAEHALDLVRTAGRSRVFVESHWTTDDQEGPAAPLLRSLGAKPVLDDYRRVLDLEAFPAVEAPPVPEGYRVLSWADRAPDDVVDGIAYLLHRMVLDAPMGEMEYEAEKWDAARYRSSEESAIRRQRTRFTTVVLHEESGEVAGLTEIAVNLSRPEVGYQWNTIVDPRHRGKRLGLLLKAVNHKAVAEAVPRLRWVNTWNAAANSWMIDVNEQLGYRVADKWTEWQLDL